jgi:hypothetical protein
MSEVIQVLEKKCSQLNAVIKHRALVNRITHGKNIISHVPLYEVDFVETFGPTFAGSDSAAARAVTSAPAATILSKTIVIAIPPRALSRLIEPSSDVLGSLTRSRMFRSTFGVPAFRAVALYRSAWWDSLSLDASLPPLRPHGVLTTLSSRLSLIVVYDGTGPNGERALHLSYCNDSNARLEEGRFWHDVVNRALASDSFSGGVRSESADAKMYETVRAELAVAFARPVEDIPEPLQFEWHFWDDGAVYVFSYLSTYERFSLSNFFVRPSAVMYRCLYCQWKILLPLLAIASHELP